MLKAPTQGRSQGSDFGGGEGSERHGQGSYAGA